VTRWFGKRQTSRNIRHGDTIRCAAGLAAIPFIWGPEANLHDETDGLNGVFGVRDTYLELRPGIYGKGVVFSFEVLMLVNTLVQMLMVFYARRCSDLNAVMDDLARKLASVTWTAVFETIALDYGG
jgi:hypothetical protein